RCVVYTDVDDSFDGRLAVRLKRTDDENPAGLHAADVAAFQLTGVERVHQPLGHRPGAVLVRVGHRLYDRFAGERVALHRKIAPGDVTGPGAEMHLVGRIRIAVDDPLAGVDRRSALGVDHPDLPRVAARILVGDPFHHFRRTQPLLEQRDRLWSVLPVRRRLRGDGADAGLGERNRGAGRKRARLHG